MDLNDIEKKLSHCRVTSTDEIPEIVRKGMEDAFRELPNLQVKRKHKWKYVWGAAAAAFVLFLGLLTSAFVSPVMAKSLKEVPFFEDIFKLTHHMGLQTAEEQGMLDEPNLSVTHAGVTLRIPKLVYTGSNIYFVLEQDTEDHRFTNRGYSVSGKVNGKIVDMTVSQGNMKNWGRTNSPAAAIVTISHADYSSKDGTPYRFPDEFTLNLEISLVGMDQEKFVFDIPVKKNESETKIITSDAPPKEWREFKISLGKIEVTPVMIRLTMHEDLSKQDLTKNRQEHLGISWRIRTATG